MPRSSETRAKTRTLAEDVEIPYLGFGTYLIGDDEAATAVSAALRAGYRHIDTAEVYQNESGVGAGIRHALASEGLARSDLALATEHLNRLESLMSQGVVGDRY